MDALPPGFDINPPAIVEEVKQSGEDMFNKLFSFKKPEVAKSQDYFKKLATIESSNNPNAKAKTSSATGLYQFTKGTWAELVKKYGKEHGLTKAGITDEAQQHKAVKLFTQDNRKQLRDKLGIPISDFELYTAHLFGVNGASKLLKAPYSKDADKVLPDAAKANKSIFYDDGKPKSVLEVIKLIQDKLDNA